MPKVKRISSNAMAKRFGGNYAGHSDAKKNTIYVDNALSKKAKGVVIDHETGHVAEGESEPFGLGAAAIIGGASLVSGYLGGKAGKAQAKVGKSQVAESRRQFDIMQEQTAPYREAGEAGLNRMRELMLGGGQVTPEMMGPGYEFEVSEGQKALQNYMTHTGMKRSGRGIKEAMRFGGGTAAKGYQNYMRNLMQMSGFGPQGVGQMGGAGARVAGSPGFGAQAQAAGTGPQAWNQAIQGGMSNYFAYQNQQKMLDLWGGGGGGDGPAMPDYGGNVWGR